MDLTDEALQASEKGYRKLMEAMRTLEGLTADGTAGHVDTDINSLLDQAFEQMSDDFNCPMALARLFELVNKINGLRDGHLPIAEVTAATMDRLKKDFSGLITNVFGLKDEVTEGGDSGSMDGIMQLVIELRNNARTTKDWGTADKIRDTLTELEIQLKDAKGVTTWTKA